MTARTSFVGAHRRIRRPAYFSPCAAAAAEQQPRERRRRRGRQRREEDRERRRRAARRPRRRAGGRPARLGVEPRADAAEQRAGGQRSRARRPATPTIRPGHQCRCGRRSSRAASSAPSTSETASDAHERVAGLRVAAAPAVDEAEHGHHDDDREQERRSAPGKRSRCPRSRCRGWPRRALRRAGSAGTGGCRSPRRCRGPVGGRGDSPWRASVPSRRMTIDETPGKRRRPAPARTRSSATAGCSRAARAA